MSEKQFYPKKINSKFEGNLSGPEFSDIRLEEMKELLNPLKEVVFKLKDKIKSGEYGLVIGDDASGRVPALILHRFLKEEYKKQHKTLNIVFLAGSRETKGLSDKKMRMEEFLRAKVPLDSEVLIVTELIHRGDSLVPLTDVLQKLGSKYDIATVGILRKYRIPELEQKLGTHITFGEETHPTLDGSLVLAGVEKDYEDLFATRLPMSQQERNIFLDGRHDIAVIANKLSAYYGSLDGSRV